MMQVERFNYFISAPSSPSRASDFYQDLDDFTANQEFAFHVTGNQASNTPVTASELFHRGTIRSPLAPGGGVEAAVSAKRPLLSTVESSKSKGGNKKSFWSNFTPKRKKHSNPYARVVGDNDTSDEERGRERGSSTSAGRRIARSLSPLRAPCSPLSLTPALKSSRKWRLRNFLLFRSASEGHKSDKDPMRKLNSFYRRSNQEPPISNTNSTTRRVSAHERHYTVNRAASEDLKKKTFLPYKQGILGRLAVNPTVHSHGHGCGSNSTT